MALRRDFLKTTAFLSTAALAGVSIPSVHAGESSELKIGLIGCGGRGCGAVRDALTIDPNVKLICAAEIFPERAESGLGLLKESFGDRIAVDKDSTFIGFDGFQKVLASDVDSVILATPQLFRPTMLKAAIEAGKHVFAEKPVAVDGAGIKMVLEAAEMAKAKGLNLVSGLVNRYYPTTIELMKRIHDGAIGNVVSAKANRLGGQLWRHPRQEGDTEMRYQMRNWVNFCWIASEWINDVTIHQIDVALWAMGDPTPTSCIGMGGRLARTEKQYPDCGDMYDSMAVSYDFGDGRFLQANSRQIPGTWTDARTYLYGTNGSAIIGNSGSQLDIMGPNAYKGERFKVPGTQMEHKALFDAMRSGGKTYVNNGKYMANSTGTCLMGRIAAYTGQTITWDDMLNDVQPKPESWSFDAVPPTQPNENGLYKIAIPGLGWGYL